jgi:hypothetical protein
MSRLPSIAALAVWLAGCTTLPHGLPGETDVLAPFAPQGQTRIPVLLSWYENCDPRGCDTNRDRAQERLIECLNEGLRKGHPNLVTYSGGRIEAIEPSALVEDPRLRGQLDARLTPESRESLKRGDAKYAVLMEATVRRDRRSASRFALGPASPIFVGRLGGTSEFTEQARFDIAIVDTTSQRWVARARRIHAAVRRHVPRNGAGELHGDGRGDRPTLQERNMTTARIAADKILASAVNKAEPAVAMTTHEER